VAVGPPSCLNVTVPGKAASVGYVPEAMYAARMESGRQELLGLARARFAYLLDRSGGRLLVADEPALTVDCYGRRAT
jgi:hypothetical protein